ncbi:hypothetical protein EYF80_038930 [Liparis tanakae]|uniref:Uncharacterized protein n=1 Tax=Liparis tanakae TaxID=230148 RepID=A0A4Z2GB44_9TELE|nr:hypothetical protein EYF80_038930 [Liparis tanakae]
MALTVEGKSACSLVTKLSRYTGEQFDGQPGAAVSQHHLAVALCARRVHQQVLPLRGTQPELQTLNASSSLNHVSQLLQEERLGLQHVGRRGLVPLRRRLALHAVALDEVTHGCLVVADGSLRRRRGRRRHHD